MIWILLACIAVLVEIIRREINDHTELVRWVEKEQGIEHGHDPRSH